MDYYFWFAQPSSILSKIDKDFAYCSAGLLVLAIILWVIKQFTKNKIKSKLINKFFYLILTLGISGLIWFGFRYENTPVFGRHFMAGLVLLTGLVWLLLILKYIFFNFSSELKEYNHELLKNKYIPGKSR